MARKNEEEDDLTGKGELLRNLAIQKLKGERLSILVFGKPYSGKSDLINSLCGEKVVKIISSDPRKPPLLSPPPMYGEFMGIPTTFHEITLEPWNEKVWTRQIKGFIGDANNNLILIYCTSIINQDTQVDSLVRFFQNHLIRSQHSSIMRKCIYILTYANHLRSDQLDTHKMSYCNYFKDYFQKFGHVIDNTPVCLAGIYKQTIPGTNYDWVSVVWFCCMEIFTGINDIVQNHTIVGHVTAQLHVALEKGMKEGYVSLNNIKMVICGPPCVGKTAFRSLLLNNPRPLTHNSTPITARPVKAIERIAAGRKIWEEMVKRIYFTCCLIPYVILIK